MSAPETEDRSALHAMQQQQRLWPDPQPLVERLGRDFFRSLPERPGVYLMRGSGEIVLYVGKAKNLRKRLGSYRVANPDRMPRRHLRLLRAVVRIELQECPDEKAALAREAELLRTLKPRFNRAGTWTGTPRFLAWRIDQDAVELTTLSSAEAGWKTCGPLGAGALHLCAVLARVVWLALNGRKSVQRLPAGWAACRIAPPVQVRGAPHDSAILVQTGARLAALFEGEVDGFCQWINECRPSDAEPFDQAWLNAELELLREWF